MSDAGDSERPRRRPVFTPRFINHLDFWKKTAPSTATRLLRFVELILDAPFTGLGKPELLRFDHQGLWSRRLTRHDRIIYRVTNTSVEFISARRHYGQGG